MAEHYSRQGDLQSAALEYEALIMETPYNASPYIRAGLLYTAMKQYDRAFQRLHKSYDLEETAVAGKMLGSLLVDKKEPAKGIKYLERSLSLNPYDTQTLYNLTGAYLLLQNVTGAKRNLDKLEQLSPGSKEANSLKAKLAKLIKANG